MVPGKKPNDLVSNMQKAGIGKRPFQLLSLNEVAARNKRLLPQDVCKH